MVQGFKVTLFAGNLSQRGITLWEHSKPANLEHNTVVIQVAINLLNMKHMFPAVRHCIMATSHSERLVSSKHSIKETVPFLWLLSLYISCTLKRNEYEPSRYTVPDSRPGLLLKLCRPQWPGTVTLCTLMVTCYLTTELLLASTAVFYLCTYFILCKLQKCSLSENKAPTPYHSWTVRAISFENGTNFCVS